MTGQPRSLTLTPVVAAVLDRLAADSGRLPRDVAGDGVMLLDSILRGQVPAETLAKMTRVNYGKEHVSDT